MKGDLTFPVTVNYTYVTKMDAEVGEERNEEDQIKYHITLDPEEDRQLRELLAAHATGEMNDYSSRIEKNKKKKRGGTLTSIKKLVH